MSIQHYIALCLQTSDKKIPACLFKPHATIIQGKRWRRLLLNWRLAIDCAFKYRVQIIIPIYSSYSGTHCEISSKSRRATLQIGI